MADHRLVEDVLAALENDWPESIFPTGERATEPPALIDGDDSRVVAGTGIMSRSQTFDRTRNNSITVSSDVERSQSPIDTDYDHQVEDGAAVEINALHESEAGWISGASEFQALVQAARAAILANRQWPLPNLGYHTLTIEFETSDSSNKKDAYRHVFDVTYDGYEDL